MNITINNREIEICSEAAQWLHTQIDAKTAWQNCENPAWMLYILTEARLLTPQQDLQLTLAFLDTPLSDGRRVEDIITDERSRAFIALKRRKLAGEIISNEEWRSKQAAALAAAYAAAADAADEAAAADDAAAALAAAALAAAAAYAAAYAAAAYAAAARRWQADKIRTLVSFPDELKEVWL